MTVTIDELTRTSPTTYRMAWSSDVSNPVYYIYQDGVLVTTTTASTRQFSVLPGESLVVEILDDASLKPETAFPGRLTLGWYATDATDHYRIERYETDVWVLKTKIRETGRGYYTYKTAFLDDVTVHQFRIVPVGTNGNSGDALVFSVLMVRHPDAPDVSFSYSSGTQQVTIV